MSREIKILKGHVSTDHVHLAVTSLDELIAAITAYIDRRNTEPKPFTWTANVKHILEKVAKANETLAALH